MFKILSWQRARRWLLALTGTLCLLLITLLLWVWFMLRAAPGEWALPVRLGPWTLQASVPTLFRVGTHPLALKVLPLAETSADTAAIRSVSTLPDEAVSRHAPDSAACKADACVRLV